MTVLTRDLLRVAIRVVGLVTVLYGIQHVLHGVWWTIRLDEAYQAKELLWFRVYPFVSAGFEILLGVLIVLGASRLSGWLEPSGEPVSEAGRRQSRELKDLGVVARAIVGFWAILLAIPPLLRFAINTILEPVPAMDSWSRWGWAGLMEGLAFACFATVLLAGPERVGRLARALWGFFRITPPPREDASAESDH